MLEPAAHPHSSSTPALDAWLSLLSTSRVLLLGAPDAKVADKVDVKSLFCTQLKNVRNTWCLSTQADGETEAK